jgi:hypothetical protein
VLGISAGLLEWLCGGAVCFGPFLAIERAQAGKDSLVIVVISVIKRINSELRGVLPVIPDFAH